MKDITLKVLTKEKPLKIYAPWFGIQNWIYRYRIEHPLLAAEALKLANPLLDTRYTEQVISGFDDAREARKAAMAIADAYWVHMIIDESWTELAQASPRPALIYGADDHTEYIEPLNDVFLYFGTRINDRVLEPGDEVCIKNHEGDKDIVRWTDGCKTKSGETFDIAENLKRIARLKSFAVLAEGIVVSTPYLAEVWRGYGAGNVYVYPNSLNFKLYPKIELAEQSDEVRILWTGGSSHLGDMDLIAKGLQKVLKKHPNARLVIFGQYWPWLHKFLGNDQVELVEWVEPHAYTYRLSTLNHDINLCPLRKSPFNEAKSAIKWYESSAICKPAATLASNFGPFTEIQDGETGLLFDTPEEFETKLSGLIEDATLRKRLASNASTWVRENRDLVKNVPPLMEWARKVVEVRKDANASTARELEDERVEEARN